MKELIKFDGEYDIISEDDNSKVFSYKDKDAFYQGGDKKAINDTFKRINKYVNKAAEAATNKGGETFKENSDLNSVTVLYPYGPGEKGNVGVDMFKNDDGEIKVSVSVKHDLMTPTKKKIVELQDKILKKMAQED